MRRRPLRRRALALLLAASFPLLSGGTLVAGHGCPHHDGGDGHLAGDHAAHEGAAGAPARDRAPSPGPVALPPGSSEDTDGPTTFCTCVGDCHAGAAVPDLPAPGGLLALSTSHAVAAPAAVAERSARRVPYLLPFANAPPAV